MAIFFPCFCGQPLRVDEERAGDHARCPACGRLARAPSLQRANTALGLPTPAAAEPALTPIIPPVPTARLTLLEETTAPPPPRATDEEETPVYRLAETDDRSDEVAKEIARDKVARWVAAAEGELAEPAPDRRAWRLERTWYECLLYPVRAWGPVLALGMVWATTIAIALSPPLDGWTLRDVVMRCPWFGGLFLLLGYTFAWLRATFAAAMEGRAGYLFWPDNSPVTTLRGIVEAMLSFLAGPVVPVAVAFFFWLESGELEFVDRLILWELCLVGVGYWALALMAVWEGERFREANPVAIRRLVQRQGYRVPLAALLLALVVVSHGRAALGALEELHQDASGWFTLLLCWSGQLFWLVFLLRWLGVSRFRAWKRRQKDRAGSEAGGEEPAPAPIEKRKRREKDRTSSLVTER